MGLHARTVLGDEAMPGGMIGKGGWRGQWRGVPEGYAKTALATARRMGVTEVCFCIATEGRLREGGPAAACKPGWARSSRVSAKGGSKVLAE